jgi:DNA-directed RNA polymerase specialized sigma24 family protein
MESTLVNSDGPPHDRVADAESMQQFRSVLFEAIRRLSAEDRLLLLLHYEQGLTLDQISTLLGSSKSTLSRRVSRARQDVFDAAGIMARERYGESIHALWQQLSPERLDFDLRAACAPSLRNDPDRNVSNL